MGLRVEKTDFLRWREAYRLCLGEAEMVVVTEIGPRILSLRVGGGPNLLFVDEEMELGTGEGDEAWHIYGGHRIWVAPENENAYAPDNLPCKVEVSDGSLTVLAPVMPRTQLQKRLTVGARGDCFAVAQGVVNRGEAIHLGAVWALTCVDPKVGVVVFPWGRGGTWDTKRITYWNRWMEHRSDVTSRQWQPGPDLFRVVPTGEEGKVGTNSPEGWVALCRPDATFIKSREWVAASYPDEDCSLQVYTCSSFIELETLGPVTTFYPGVEVVHEEIWTVTPQAVDPGDGAALRRLLGVA
jgi:hypothetical protein